MERVVVRGSSGSGKTTLAAALAERLDAPHVELDALFHLPGWEQRPDDDFRRVVAEATSGDRWVADGNYRIAMDVVRPQADTVIWLDLPRTLVMRRVIPRTIGRGLLRRELWNGNRERLWNLFNPVPEQNIVLWAWTTWDRRHAEALAAATDPDWAHARVVRLATPAEVATFLASAAQP